MSGECLCSRLCQSLVFHTSTCREGGVPDKKGGGVNYTANIKQDLSFRTCTRVAKSGFQIIIILRPGRD